MEAAPHLMGVDQDALLYKAWKEVLGQYPPYVAQQIGDCTGFGSGHALDLTECIEISLGHQSEEYKETCTEATYAIGREIAHMLDNQDGCFGTAVAKALTDFGALPREEVGPYSGKRAKDWGLNGVPSDIKKIANQHRLGIATLATTLAEWDAGLANGYVGIVCSSQGFTTQDGVTPAPRDTDGVVQPSGIWPHCMPVLGRRKKNGRRQYLIGQNWGPNVPSGPLSDDQPDFSFWIDEAVFGRMISERDSLFFSKWNGYPRRPLPSSWSYSTMA